MALIYATLLYTHTHNFLLLLTTDAMADWSLWQPAGAPSSPKNQSRGSQSGDAFHAVYSLSPDDTAFLLDI
jgi:hypothetical protein